MEETTESIMNVETVATNLTYGLEPEKEDSFMDEVEALVMHKLTTFTGTY